MLRESRAAAERLGLLDERFRADANLTTVLDLLGRRREALAVAFEGIEAAKRAGLEEVYGNFLRGNAAETLFSLGRWDELRQLSLEALAWGPAGAWGSAGATFEYPALNLAIVEIESNAGELAGSLLGQLLVGLETSPDLESSVPTYLAAASLARWRGDLDDARRAIDAGWRRVSGTEDWALMTRVAALAAEIEATAAVEARARRDLAAVLASRATIDAMIAQAESTVARAAAGPASGSRGEAEALIATARMHRARAERHDSADGWRDLAVAWTRLGVPYHAARARWHEAEARLRSGDAREARPSARGALEAAYRTALSLGAGPLIRELRDLAERALIPLPPSRPAVGERTVPVRRARPGTVRVRGRGAGRARVAGGRTVGEPGGIARADGRRGVARAEARPVRAEPAGARGPRAHRRGPDEPGDRRAALHQRADGPRPRRPRPLEARRVRPGRGGRGRDPPRPHRDRSGHPGAARLTVRRPGHARRPGS